MLPVLSGSVVATLKACSTPGRTSTATWVMPMIAADNDAQQELASIWFPGIDDGIEGVRFIERCVESADNGSQWVNV